MLMNAGGQLGQLTPMENLDSLLIMVLSPLDAHRRFIAMSDT